MQALSASALVQQISTSLPAHQGLIREVHRPRLASGVAAVDAILSGGLPVGVITEVVGTPSSGRTTFALSAVARLQRHDLFAAWVDAADGFDPVSAAAMGVIAERLLWVRCGVDADNPNGISRIEQERPVQWSVPGEAKPKGAGSHSPHPRSEACGLTEAVNGFLHHPASAYRRDKTIGTPGVHNLPLRDEAYRKEQPNSDRQPARRGAFAGKTHRVTQLHGLPQTVRRSFRTSGKLLSLMDQALRATDLLLNAGGFAVLVLDCGGITPEVIHRVPLATWFRFRAAAQRSRTVLLLLTQHSSARSAAEILLATKTRIPKHGTVMPELEYEVSLLRQRSNPPSNIVPLRKPAQSDHTTTWSAQQQWAGAQ